MPDRNNRLCKSVILGHARLPYHAENHEVCVCVISVLSSVS